MKSIAKYAVIAAAVAPLLVFAQVGTIGSVTGGPTTIQGVWSIIQTVMNWIVAVFFLYATYNFIMAAWSYVGSSGDPDALKEIRSKVIAGVVGVAVALLAFSLPRIVQSFLGVNITG